jgi:hypothetical protein
MTKFGVDADSAYKLLDSFSSLPEKYQDGIALAKFDQKSLDLMDQSASVLDSKDPNRFDISKRLFNQAVELEIAKGNPTCKRISLTNRIAVSNELSN